MKSFLEVSYGIIGAIFLIAGVFIIISAVVSGDSEEGLGRFFVGFLCLVGACFTYGFACIVTAALTYIERCKPRDKKD